MYSDAPQIVAGHADAVLLGGRLSARVHRRAEHVVPDPGHRVAGHAGHLFRHVHVDAGLAAIAVGQTRRRAEGHGIAEVVARQPAGVRSDQGARRDQGKQPLVTARTMYLLFFCLF